MYPLAEGDRILGTYIFVMNTEKVSNDERPTPAPGNYVLHGKLLLPLGKWDERLNGECSKDCVPQSRAVCYPIHV